VAGESLLVQGPRARAILGEAAARHGFSVTAVRERPSGVGVTRQRLPRIGLYQPWTANIDEGWTRWLFEQYGISYTTLHDNDFKKGALRQRFDVIVLRGHRCAGSAARHRFDSHSGTVRRWARRNGRERRFGICSGGGTLVCLDASSNFAITRLNLPVVNVLAGEASVRSLRFYAPGSIFGVLWEGWRGG